MAPAADAAFLRQAEVENQLSVGTFAIEERGTRQAGEPAGRLRSLLAQHQHLPR